MGLDLGKHRHIVTGWVFHIYIYIVKVLYAKFTRVNFFKLIN